MTWRAISARPSGPATLVKLFETFDADHSGTMDVVEFETFTKYLVALVSKRRCEVWWCKSKPVLKATTFSA